MSHLTDIFHPFEASQASQTPNTSSHTLRQTPGHGSWWPARTAQIPQIRSRSDPRLWERRSGPGTSSTSRTRRKNSFTSPEAIFKQMLASGVAGRPREDLSGGPGPEDLRT